MEIVDQKQQIRAEIKHRLKLTTQSERDHFSSRINAKLFDLIHQKNWQHIGMFAPLHNEPNIWFIFDELEKDAEKKTFHFYFPRIIVGKNEIEMIEINDREQMIPGPMGIREPPAHQPVRDPAQLDVIFIPGQAFDYQGNRLGRGKGIYDRFLARLPNTVETIGVCFPFQLLSRLPTQLTDQSVNQVMY